MSVSLVTGANRGIGLEFVRQLSQIPDSTVVATVRDPSKATDLKALLGKNIDVVQLGNEVEKDTKKVAEYVKQKYGKVDLVVANAGFCTFGNILDAKRDDIRSHLITNYVNVFILFQELYPLLKAARHSKFVGISAGGGSITNINANGALGIAAYGASKAALNYFLKRAAFESKADGVTIGVVDPGMVDSGKQMHELIETLGTQSFAKTPAEGVAAMLNVIDSLSIDDDVVMHSWDGSVIAW